MHYKALSNDTSPTKFKIFDNTLPTASFLQNKLLFDWLSSSCLGRWVHSLGLRGRVWAALWLWIVRWRLSRVVSNGRLLMNSLLCGSCGHKRLIWSTLDNHCSRLTVTIIRTTRTTAAGHDGSNDDDHQTADNNACDASSRDCTIVAVAV